MFRANVCPSSGADDYTRRKKIKLSRQLLKMGTRWPETCWATYKEQLIRRNKYNTKVLFCAFGIPYALNRIILWGNLSMNTTVCNVRHAVWAMLFAGRCSSTSWLSAGGLGGGFFLLFHSVALLPVSAHSIGAVFVLFSLVFRGGCRLL